MYERETEKSAFGHVVGGATAQIKDSPVNITVNIYVNSGDSETDEQGRLTEFGKAARFIARIIPGFNLRDHASGRRGKLVEKGDTIAIEAVK